MGSRGLARFSRIAALRFRLVLLSRVSKPAIFGTQQF